MGVALSIVGVGVFYEGLGAGSASLSVTSGYSLAAVSVGVSHCPPRAVLGTPHALDGCDLPPIPFSGLFVLLLSAPSAAEPRVGERAWGVGRR